jgi:perosamine synthetase
MQIPLSRPDITQAEIDAVVDVLHTPTLSIGPRIEEFESLAARLAGRRHAIGVSSGTAGLHCAMIAAGVGPGDEVITTPFSFVASANCALYVGARPVFVDIEPRTLNIDVNKVEAAITPRTRAVVAVEVFGHPAGMMEIEALCKKHNLTLIEDACEGLGGTVRSLDSALTPHPAPPTPRAIGSFGLASVFAFYPNKQITTGEGGMIVTDDASVAAACRALRNQGRTGMAWLAHERLGYNYRLSEIHAALGVAQMRRLPEILENRRRVAHAYIRRLMTSRFLIVPTLLEGAELSWFVFVVRLNDLFAPGDRDLVMQELRALGIGCSNYFPPIHLQPYMAERFGYQPGDFPVCEYVAARTLALPFFGQMTGRQVGYVCETLERVLEKMLMGRKKRL